MKYRLAVFDVDATLLPSGAGKIPGVTVDKLLEANAAGMHLAIASGRPPGSILALLESSGVPSPFIESNIVIVGFNGAVAVHSGRVIRKETLAPAVAREVIEFCQACAVANATFFQDGRCLILHDSAWRHLYAARLKNEIYVAQDLKFCNIFKIIVMSPGGDTVTRDRIDAFMASKPAATVRAVTQWKESSSPAEWLEVMSPRVNKGRAVLDLAADLKIPLSQVACFGDGMNDLEMLQIPEVLSIVIGESPYPEVRQAALIEANPCDAELPGVVQILTRILDDQIPS
jgi:hydroxymethylpyrimidine pyrophosphatase-like HAD family hydrolase